MTKRALIGYTGFVGSNLLARGDYSHLYNSSNYRGMSGQVYDEVVCAGISAVKWRANKEPDQDWAAITSLLDLLSTVEAHHFTLISTIDVYPKPNCQLDESAILHDLPNCPYGRHRLQVEHWISEHFPDHLIVRLPALFGMGLKKNALYDLLHDNEVHKINPAAIFQWYPLGSLHADLKIARSAGVRRLNLFSEPFSLGDLISMIFPKASVGPFSQPALEYNVRTRYAALFGGPEGYRMTRQVVLQELLSFVETYRAHTNKPGISCP